MKYFGYLLLAFLILVADQWTKALAQQHLSATSAVEITSFLQFVLVYNRGAAFGFLAGAGGWQLYLFAGLALVIAVVLPVWIWRCYKTNATLAIGLACVLGGAIGNLIDRLNLQYVVDFISLHYAGWYFPAFNIADIAITLGAICLILDSFGIYPRNPKSVEN
ncbi:MAG: signal peptidase II [Pseudomonadota bacterium]